MAITPSWALYKVGSGSWGVVVKKWQLDILESKIVGWNLRCHIWRRENILQFAIFSFLIFNYLFSYFICFFLPPPSSSCPLISPFFITFYLSLFLSLHFFLYSSFFLRLLFASLRLLCRPFITTFLYFPYICLLLFKSQEHGFDPEESRWKRNKAGALVAIEYKSSDSGCG